MRWLVMARFDSRNLLKFLIIFNLLLATYQIFTFHFSSESKSCVLNVQSSSLSQDKRSEEVFIPLKSEGVGHHDKYFHNLLNSPRNLKAESSSELTDSFLSSASSSSFPSLLSSPRTPWWTAENRSRYIVIHNYILPQSFNTSATDPDSVTLSTQGTYEFLNHVENLCLRWDGPLSVAVYAPGDDLPISIRLIYFMRSCRHQCIREKVSWHIIYDIIHGPEPSKLSFPDEIANSPTFDCSLTYENFYPSNQSNYRNVNKLAYPINVARNVARLSVRTKYLLASDIELYPSLHVVQMFKKLLERERNNQVPLINPKVPHVYVLPIFEVKSNLKPPLTKRELNKMIKNGDAIFFHRWVCDICQNFPDRMQWIDTIPENDSLNIFRVTQRLRSRSTWEPLYIGTNADPLYEERLSWEGKKDKMSQMFEMCLISYDMLILDNAFLVHAPGIKHIDFKDQQKRLPFMKRNERVYKTVISKLIKKYGNKNRRC